MIVLKMLIKALNNPYCLRSIIVMGFLVCVLSSCERANVRRDYEEVVVKPQIMERRALGHDPHDFMGFNHPPIDNLMQLPAGSTPEMQKALDESAVKAPLTWTTPKGWSEQKGSGMRLATFTAKSANGTIECSLISLGGQAGGLESNVARWMRQINITQSDELLSQFLSRQKDVKAQGGFSLKLIDLSELTQANSPSMMAAIASLESMTIFVKMTGTHNAVIDHRKAFTELIQSLSLQ